MEICQALPVVAALGTTWLAVKLASALGRSFDDEPRETQADREERFLRQHQPDDVQ